MSFINSQNEYQQLLSAEITGDIWIEAGCGSGTYTIPLSRIVTSVIAFDNDYNRIKHLENYQYDNITTFIHDFNDPNWPIKMADGVLFAFSLHYSSSPEEVLVIALNHIKSGGELVVIDYTSEFPIPWVPYPIPLNQLRKILANIPEVKVDLIKIKKGTRSYSDWNNSSYILKAYKI